MMQNLLKNKYFQSGVLIILSGAAILLFLVYVMQEPMTEQREPKSFISGLENISNILIKKSEDPASIYFSVEKLSKMCPSYMPDGAHYRDCLANIVERQKASIKQDPEIRQSLISDVEDYCHKLAQPEDPNIGAVSEYLSCMIYKLYPMTASISDVYTNESLCKEGSYEDPSAEEVQYNEMIKNDAFVKYLRLALDNYLADGYDGLGQFEASNGCSNTGLFDGAQCPDGATDLENPARLSMVSAEYLASKFIVLQTDQAPGGGESIVIMPKDKPDKLFYAWVYAYPGGKGYDLRAFKEYDPVRNGAPSIEETQKVYINQICDSKMGA